MMNFQWVLVYLKSFISVIYCLCYMNNIRSNGPQKAAAHYALPKVGPFKIIENFSLK